MTHALTLSAKGVNNITYQHLFKLFVSQNWGFITNLDIKEDVAYINLVNWKDKFPNTDKISLQYKDKIIEVIKLEWSPRKKWNKDQFSCLTSFIECGR